MTTYLRRFRKWFMKPETRVKFAWAQLWLSIVGYPVAALTFAKDEPKAILFLSFYAITITAWDVICTSDARMKLEE